MRKRNIYRNSISRITRSAVLLAAALPALLLPSGCERENLLKELAGEEAVMRFSVSESVPELLTKSQAAQSVDHRETTEENVIVLTSADGRTLRLIAEEEPLTASTSSASAEASVSAQGPATKAAKIYSQSAALADNETFAVWAYNIAATASSFYDWKLDIGLPKSGSVLVPAQATKDGSYWKPSPDIQYNTEKLNAHRTRWFALAPWGAYSSEDLTLNHVPVSMGTTLPMAYTIPSGREVAQQWDLLAATTSPRVAEETTPVDLTFVHVLTGIRFKRDKDLDISSITVSGVYNSATLDLLKLPQTPQPLSSGSAPSLSEYTNVDGTSMSGATTDLWSNRTKSVTAPATEPSWTMDMTSATWTNGNPKETQYDYAKEDANILMMIPQLTPQGAKITVTIDGIEYAGDISGHRWLPGRLVTYRIDKQPPFFSVSDTKRVVFAPGNVQFTATLNADGSYTNPAWRFAAEQWEVIGSAADYTAPASGSKSVTYDLFGWATAGVKNPSGNYGADETHVNYQPWSTSVASDVFSENYAGYGPSNNTWTAAGGTFDASITNTWCVDPLYEYCDWGVHFGGGWYTLSAAEWIYLFNHRGSDKSGYATVNGVQGVIFLPDNETIPAGSSFSAVRTDFTTNTYTAAEWAVLESSGAVFLPLAGYRQGTNFNNTSGVNFRGHYWTSSASSSNSAQDVYGVTMGGTGNYTIYVDKHWSRRSGLSVRLVRDYE